MAERILTLRELNRALLARQLLLERRSLSVAKAVERVGALQAQWSRSPYVALWSRLEGFRIEQLERALAARKVVKATLMRSTLHIVSGADYVAFAAAIVAARRERVERSFPGVSLDTVAARMREATTEAPGSWDEWRQLVVDLAARAIKPGEIWPLWTLGLMHAQLVHLPPSGSYGYSGLTVRSCRRARPTGRRARADEAARHAVSRRLRAGIGRRHEVVDGRSDSHLRRVLPALELRTFRDEQGRLLYDLPRAPLPPADAPAPARYLPKWNSALLAYAPPERERILPEGYRKRVIAPNGDVAQTFLVDGFVAGTWKVDRRRLVLEPFKPVPKPARAELEAEGERLLEFLP